MRPALVAFTWLNHIDQPFLATEGLRWHDQVGDLCSKCPLGCCEHPHVRDEKDEYKYHKLCTAWFIAAGNGTLQELREGDRGLELDEEMQQAEDLIGKLRNALQGKKKRDRFLHIFTVRNRPVALDRKGAVHAIELGYFPISSTGYRSLYCSAEEDDVVTAEEIAELQKQLEGLASENDKSKKSHLLRAHRFLKTKKSTGAPVDELISGGGCVDSLIGDALFSDPEEQKGLLSVALKISKRLAQVEVPDTSFKSGAWTYEHVARAVQKVQRKTEAIRQSLQDGHMMAFVECKDLFIAGLSTYGEIFRGELSLTEDAPENEPEAVKPAPEPRVVIDRRRLRKACLFGWKHAEGHQLYCYRGVYSHDSNLPAWGATDNQDEAYRFGGVEDCMDFWRTRYSFPEDYEHCIWDGYLQFFEETKAGIRQVLPPTKQHTLF